MVETKLFPKKTRLTAKEGHTLLLMAGYRLIRTNGSHRIYSKDGKTVIISFHPHKTLHPKTTKDILLAIKVGTI